MAMETRIGQFLCSAVMRFTAGHKARTDTRRPGLASAKLFFARTVTHDRPLWVFVRCQSQTPLSNNDCIYAAWNLIDRFIERVRLFCLFVQDPVSISLKIVAGNIPGICGKRKLNQVQTFDHTNVQDQTTKVLTSEYLAPYRLNRMNKYNGASIPSVSFN